MHYIHIPQANNIFAANSGGFTHTSQGLQNMTAAEPDQSHLPDTRQSVRVNDEYLIVIHGHFPRQLKWQELKDLARETARFVRDARVNSTTGIGHVVVRPLEAALSTYHNIVQNGFRGYAVTVSMCSMEKPTEPLKGPTQSHQFLPLRPLPPVMDNHWPEAPFASPTSADNAQGGITPFSPVIAPPWQDLNKSGGVFQPQALPDFNSRPWSPVSSGFTPAVLSPDQGMAATSDPRWAEYFTEWGRGAGERPAIPLQQINTGHLTHAEVTVAPQCNLETNVQDKMLEVNSNRPASYSESTRSDDGDLSTYGEVLSPADIHRPLIIDGSKSE